MRSALGNRESLQAAVSKACARHNIIVAVILVANLRRQQQSNGDDIENDNDDADEELGDLNTPGWNSDHVRLP